MVSLGSVTVGKEPEQESQLSALEIYEVSNLNPSFSALVHHCKEPQTPRPQM